MRPKIVHFLAIKTNESINVRASITKGQNDLIPKNEIEIIKPSNPWDNISLLGGRQYRLKLICLDKKRDEIYSKEFDSDSRGNFNFKIPLTDEIKNVEALRAYETLTYPGLDVNLGTLFPLVINDPKKIIISDFDKTLVDTKYSTTKDVYYSLTKPLDYFPTVQESVDIYKSYIAQGFHPFILSASPHFYEDPIRDWLYQNKIFTAGIFLKDYRLVFNVLQSELTTKDIKVQGLYKLNHLLDIILMTGIPDELTLMGDNFESDPLIYLTLAALLTGEIDPWALWNNVRRLESFQLNSKQNGQFLNKLYQMKSLLKHKMSQTESQNTGAPKLTIYIRKTHRDDSLKHIGFFKDIQNKIKLYDVHLKNEKIPAGQTADNIQH